MDAIAAMIGWWWGLSGVWKLIVTALTGLLVYLLSLVPGMRTLAVFAGRFVSGRVVTREQTRWDARYETWAPRIPDNHALMPGDDHKHPRTSWARRPGWHRQVVRLGSIALTVAWLTWPKAITALAVAVAVGWVATKRTRALACRRVEQVTELFEEPLAEKLGWGAAHPVAWFNLPTAEWQWLPLSVPQWLTERGLSWMIVFPGGQTVRHAVAGWAWWAVNRPLAKLRLPRRVPPAPLSDSETTVQIKYPKTFNGHEENIKEAVRIVTSRMEGEWEHTHHPRKLEIELRHPVKFPTSFDVTQETFAQYSATEIPYAVNKHGEIETIPLKAKTPHISVAASTGWGKTTVANVITGHLLYHGAFGVILDPKLVGYTHYVGLPNVELCTALRSQLRGIRRVLEEMNRRYQVIEQHGPRALELGFPSMKENPELYFRPLVLTEDEKGSLTVAIKSWWKQAPTEEWELDYKEGQVNSDTGTVEGKAGKGDPLPLLEEQQILWRGRAAAVHMVTLAQQNNLYVFLNSDMRDQYMMRLLYGPQTASSWRMTFPGTRQKKMGSKKGRGVAGIGAEEQKEILGGNISDDEAAAAANHGVTVSEELDQARAERLAAVTGRPVWEVSPLAAWMPRPAGSASSVPEQPAGTGTGEENRTENIVRSFSVIRGQGEESEHVSEKNDLGVVEGELVEEDVESSVSVPAPREEGQRENGLESSEQRGENDGMLVGIAAAAEYLGMKRETFTTYRKRDKKKGIEVPGSSTREDGVAVFDPVALEEWRNQHHPRSARAASGE